MEQNDLGDFGRGSSREHFCEIILKSDDWPMRTCCLKFFSIFSFDSHLVQRRGTIFGRGSPKKYFCKIILKSGHWPTRKCRI